MPKKIRKRTASKQRHIRRDIGLSPKTEGQAAYLKAIEQNDIVICDGPPGSGKSFLAVGAALTLMRQNPDKYKRLVMVRPHLILQGEEMGFLPGDIGEKMAPFIAPIMDSLGLMLNTSEIQTLVEVGVIEVIPLAFMRGRTLSNCVVIFDEAQNSRWEHMKMFLTRIGSNAKAIVEGDGNQSDLEFRYRETNGLKMAAMRLKGVEGVATISLEPQDIIRSEIVKRILDRLSD